MKLNRAPKFELIVINNSVKNEREAVLSGCKQQPISSLSVIISTHKMQRVNRK